MKAFALACALIVGASPACAQNPFGAFANVFRVDAQSALVIEADSLTLDKQGEEAVFEGRVFARQGVLTLEAERARARFEGFSGQNRTARKLRLEGGVVLRAGAEASAEGAWAEYDARERTLVMEGAPVKIRHKGSALTGKRLTLDLAAGRGALTGGRVRGVLTPPAR